VNKTQFLTIHHIWREPLVNFVIIGSLHPISWWWAFS